MKYFILWILFSFLIAPSMYAVSSATTQKTQISVKTTKNVSKKTVTQSKKNTSKKTLCDSNYSPCVPIASDVDCAGWSGDGPIYVKGPIRVIGKDIYRLDHDKDGIACEK
jgi:resuscitation-promoting factor RpfB